MTKKKDCEELVTCQSDLSVATEEVLLDSVTLTKSSCILKKIKGWGLKKSGNLSKF